nr:hypothetical protein [Rhizobium sp. T1473]
MGEGAGGEHGADGGKRLHEHGHCIVSFRAALGFAELSKPTRRT